MNRLALVGYGRWGKKHLAALQKIIGTETIWIYDTNPDLAREKWPMNCRFTTDYADLLNDRQVTGIIIASPPASHYDLGLAALAKGKHVLIEKPFTDTPAQARELHVLAQKKGLVALVGHMFLFSPAIRKLQELIRDGDLGQIRYLKMRRSGPGPITRGVSALWNLSPHDIYLANLLLGQEPRTAFAQEVSSSSDRPADTCSIILRYPQTLVSIHVSQVEPIKIRTIEIVGDRQTAIFDDQAAEKLKLYGQTDPSRITVPTIETNLNLLEAQSRYFLERLKGGPATLDNDGQAGYINVKILASLQESSQRGQPVEINQETA